MSNRLLALAGPALVAGVVAGCTDSPASGPAPAAPAYPAGWEAWGHDNDFRVPTGGPLMRDAALGEWYEKGLARLPHGPAFGGGWSCMARSRTADGLQYAVSVVTLPEPRTYLATVVADTFAMIAQRSPDMKEIGGAGPGYGQGKAYESEAALLFVRIGTTQTRMYIVSVRGDKSLDANEPHLRAFFDGFTPLMP